MKKVILIGEIDKLFQLRTINKNEKPIRVKNDYRLEHDLNFFCSGMKQ